MLEFFKNMDNVLLLLSIATAIIFIGFNVFINNIEKMHKKLFIISNIILAIITFLSIFTSSLATMTYILLWYFIIINIQKINYLTSKENKKSALLECQLDGFCIIALISLFAVGFIKFFLLQNIPLNVEEILENMHGINEYFVNCAFAGTFILIARLFYLIPLNYTSDSALKISPIILLKHKLYGMILGTGVIIKAFALFSNCFIQFQEILAIFIILNIIWFTLIIFKTKDIIKFITTSIGLHFSYAISSLLVLNKISYAVFSYYLMASIFSITLLSFMFIALCNKYKTTNINQFCAIKDKTKTTQILTIFSLINMAKIVPIGLFIPSIIACINIFSYQYEDILSYSAYLIIISYVIYALSIISIIYKLIINVENGKIDIQLQKKEIIIILLMIFIIMCLCIYPQYYFNNFMMS